MHVSSRYVINLGERAVTIKIIYFIFHFHSKCMRSGEYYKSWRNINLFQLLEQELGQIKNIRKFREFIKCLSFWKKWENFKNLWFFRQLQKKVVFFRKEIKNTIFSQIFTFFFLFSSIIAIFQAKTLIFQGKC